MALTLVQKSSTFKPDMIGEVVEVTAYRPADGSMTVAVGVLRSYFTGSAGIRAEFDGDTDLPSVAYTATDLEQINVSISHYEFDLQVFVEEDDE